MKKESEHLSKNTQLIADIRFNLGQAYAQMGSKQTLLDAIKYYYLAFEKQEKETDLAYNVYKHKTLFNLGIALRRKGSPEKSIDVFRKAQNC